MSLSNQEVRTLRAKAHALKPIVMIGQHGLTESVQTEIDRALTDHELIKIKVAGADKDARKTIAETIAETQEAELIQTIGGMLVLYRKSDKNN